MNKLALQSTCFDNIKTLCTNYNKDSKSRKTQEYLNKRLSSLEAQWMDFNARHTLLLQEIEDKNIHYFAEDVYGKTKNMFEATKADILKMLQTTEENVKFDLTDLSGEPDEKTKTLLTKQECNFKAIDRAMAKIDVEAIAEKWELDDHLSILKSKWDAIDKTHWELEAILKGSNSNYNNMFVTTEEKYDELRKTLSRKIWSTAHYERSAPKIEVPEFSGNYTQWISFKDLFMETIHNNPRINKAQKMQHLKTRLRGEAERLVQHLSISAENYTSCWEILTQRFDNRRLQCTSFLNIMLNLPVIQQPDSFNLKKMHDVITECMNGLANIGLDIATWDPIIVHLMSQKLDTTSYGEYTKELRDPRDVPNLNELLDFLENKFMAYETMKNTKKEAPNQRQQVATRAFNKHHPARLHNYDQQKSFKKTYHTAYGHCPNCDGNHVLMNCPKFINMDSFQRNDTVSKLHVCKNCLYSHGNTNCASSKTCKECNRKHHTLLHNADKGNNTNSSNTERNNKNPGQRLSTSTSKQTSNHVSTNEMEILLTTVQLKIKSANGDYMTLRALLDQGSQVNLITENAAQMLRLPRKRLNATITGVGAAPGSCKGRLQLTCKSIHSDYAFETQALILSKLTNNLPNSSFEKANWPHIENLKLADPEFNVSSPIDLLLGADVYSDIILDGVLKGSQQSPVAQQTHLGWILCGKLKTFNCHMTLVDLSELTKFWENEDITSSNHDMMPKDDQCEEYYSRTVQRDADNKYIVKMPTSPELQDKLGKSRSIAVSQFLQLEKRLEKNNKLATMYRDFIREYMQLQHMKPASPPSTTVPECYLPHHGVLREQSTTTKLRVVFNASQRTTTGHSLNSLMEKGPNLQKDIQNLILKWRTYKYAFTADIEKMYRCIWIAEDQQPLQKIIWRNSPAERLQEYQLCTVTYGTKSAPWLAMRTLKQLALDDGHKYPDAAKILLNEFYVDDVISGHYCLEKAKDLQSSLINLLNGGGMNLRKWTANHPALLESLDEDQISTKGIFDFKTEDSTKTLGLGWNPNLDTFMFNWSLEEKSKGRTTKRHLLSEISKLYDPLGWLAPITVSAKLLFQRVWNSKLAWDEELPSDILNEWVKMKTELPDARKIKLNRWIGARQSIELLGFCDASEKAYACVIYSRVRNEKDTPTVTLLVAKTRVAPLSQKTTLPRLELCGALLLSKLMAKTAAALSGYTLSVQAWCDSQVVLAWLQGDASRWDRYVSNRVEKIKQVIPSDKWRYVKSAQNPADCASRGMMPSKLINFELWWNGPAFLIEEEEESDLMKNSTCLFTTNQERINLAAATLEEASKNNEHFINILLHKHSSLMQVIRVTAQVLRFIATARSKMKPETTYLTVSELKSAADRIITYAQTTELQNECKQLKANGTVNNKSTIYKLNPYMDEKGIIRVGGRLKNSDLPFEMKHPIILPRKGRLTQLIIEQAHLKTLHGGARLTLAQIRQRYWIVGSNRAVKTQLRHCVRCHRYKPTDSYQLMADLPQQRATPSRPFTHTGVDFTGHVYVKLNKGRGVKTTKGYIAVFVCMATKAVHIELVSDLSTETFIAAFQRMCARRGTPQHVYSDCGTNFIGASKMLRNEYQQFQQELSPVFFHEIGKMEVEWHFNAPAWPSAGGLWEAAVKSMKHHLHRVLGDQKLTFEEFTTLLAKIEACMNSRPLCPLTEDPEEFQNYLTPGHFLTGSPTMSLPISSHSDEKYVNLRQRWQLTEHMLHQFWKSWSSDYLTQLQTRGKWNKPKKNIQEGDIVLIKDNNLPPGKWAMGRVLELHPGPDGYVRVTTVKTQTGVIKRPIVKLSPLPIDTTGNESDENCKTELEKHDGTKKPIKTIQSGARKCLTNILMCVFTMLILVNESYGSQQRSGTQITSLEPERPIYYDTIGKIELIHDEWTLLTYYNLTTYWQGVQHIEKYVNGVNELCQKIHQSYCQATTDQLLHEMELLNFYDTILLAPHKHLSVRKKRGLIDGVGMVANSLFGVLDQKFAEKYHRDINAIQNNENYLRELAKNQTSIMQLQNDVLKKNDENIKLQCKMIELFMAETKTNLGSIETEIQIMMATSYFNSASLTASLLLQNLKEIQTMLLNTLTNVYSGHMDVHLITPASLVRQLEDISGRLPRTLSLPTENLREDIKEIYKLMYVKARITKNYFMFEVHIPLISDEDFTYYRAIAIPFKTESNYKMMMLTSPYIAVNFEKNSYISLKEEDFKQCTKKQKDNYICKANMPVFNLQNKNTPCEAKLLGHRTTASPCDVHSVSCEETWIKLQASNSWLVICCGTCELRTVCENDVIPQSIRTAAIITLGQGCVLRSKELTIASHNQYNSNLNVNYDMRVPNLDSPINNIVNVTLHNAPHALFTLKKNEFEEIDEKLRFQRENEPKLPSTITDHDVHQYTICYILLTIAVVTFLWVMIKKYCSRLRKQLPTNTAQTQENIELQPMGQQPANSRLPENQQAATDYCHPKSQDNIAFNFD